MKNKKILFRILALCSVVVLLFALALPCFADETEQPFTNAELWELLAQQDDNYNDNSAYALLRENQFNDIDIYEVGYLYLFSMPVSYIVEFFRYDSFDLILDPNERINPEIYFWYVYGLVTLTIDGSVEPDLVYDIDSIEFNCQNGYGAYVLGSDSNGNEVFEIRYDFYDGAYEFSSIDIGNGRYHYSSGDDQNNDELDFVVLVDQYSCFYGDDFYRSFTDDQYVKFNPRGFALGVNSGYAVKRTDGVVPPAKTGLFGQLYYILSDAIYGENVVLGSTQDFALTLVTTLLVLCVVLLPVLLVIAILFKLFRW